MTRTAEPVAKWAVVATFALSLVGLAVSIYLTFTHFQPQDLLCSGTGTIDCAAVTTSAQSYFFGVPVAILGLITYVVLCVFNSPWGWRAKWYWWHVARFFITVISMGFVLWLVYAELIIIDHICLYCTSVHVITFALLIVLTRVSPVQLGWTRSRTQ